MLTLTQSVLDLDHAFERKIKKERKSNKKTTTKLLYDIPEDENVNQLCNYASNPHEL